MTFKARSSFIPFKKPRYRLIYYWDVFGPFWLCYECSLGNHWTRNFREKIPFYEDGITKLKFNVDPFAKVNFRIDKTFPKIYLD